MPKKILIVDDDLFIRELYQEILKDAGFVIDTAVDGEEGFKKIQTGSYDLILLDVMMPKLDGLGLLTKLQETPSAKTNGPIVLLTNLTHNPMLKSAKQKGAADFLVKADFNPDQFVAKVKTFLK